MDRRVAAIGLVFPSFYELDAAGEHETMKRLVPLVAAWIASGCGAPDLVATHDGGVLPTQGVDGGSSGWVRVPNSIDLDGPAPPTQPAQPAQPIAIASGHPRLWLRPSDVTRLRSWATSDNPMFEEGLKPAVDQAIKTYEEDFFPNGAQNPSWPDTGIENWVSYATEAYAELFAFMSLIDPDAGARAKHAERAKSLLMHVIDEAAKGDQSGAPFRSPIFATYNRASYWGEAFGLTVDWIYPSLSAEDKSAIRSVFLRWSAACVDASTAGSEHPQPVGVTDDPSLLADTKQLRWAANNYFAAHARQLALMSLAFDPEDDPPVDASKPSTALGNTLRSYAADVTGAWLYQQYAVYEEPAIAAAALNVPSKGLGVASGGLPVEGFLYGESQGYVLETLLALRTAGADDPIGVGPQATLARSVVWDRMLAGFQHSIAPSGRVSSDPSHGYLGPIYSLMGYGDVLRAWITPEMVVPLATLGALDRVTGRADRLPALRWLAENALEGGAGKLFDRASGIWGNSEATQSILYFMLFGPDDTAPSDPRPSQPTTFIDRSIGRVLARTDWSTAASWFGYLCMWETINHQQGNCNQIEWYRKGEWIVKERSNYANDFVGATSDYHDTIALQNDKPHDLQWFEAATSDRGGQWTNGMNAGDPTVQISAGGGLVYAAGDATNLYNRPGLSGAGGGAMDIVHASRAVVWLKPDRVIVYDRATSKTANRFKRFNLTLATAASVTGKTATAVTAGGQTITIQTLLPSSATLTVSAAENFDRVAELEPTNHRLVVEDLARPTDVRFLHVLQASDGAAAPPAALVSSTGATAVQGAVVDHTAVLFPVSATAAFAGTTYTVPSSTAVHVITGLAPGGAYSFTSRPAGASAVTITVSAGGDRIADDAGVLKVVTGSPSIALGSMHASVPSEGARGSVGVITLGDAAWTAKSSAAWITIAAGASGSGEGVVTYDVRPNVGAARSATIAIAGATYTVDQAAGP